MTLRTTILSSLFLLAAACGGAKPKTAPDPGPQPMGGGGTPCSAEIALACAEGAADGCLDGRTQFHVCVADGETAGPPCENEILKVCGDGQVDACLTTPQYASAHLCVFAPAAAAAPTSSCPEGQDFYVEGCGTGTRELPAQGCYASCSDGATCGDGFTCEAVDIDPCHGQMCDACGASKQLCIPAV